MLIDNDGERPISTMARGRTYENGERSTIRLWREVEPLNNLSMANPLNGDCRFDNGERSTIIMARGRPFDNGERSAIR